MIVISVDLMVVLPTWNRGKGESGFLEEHSLEYVSQVGFVVPQAVACLLYTSDAADDLLCVDLGGGRIIKNKNRLTQYRIRLILFIILLYKTYVSYDLLFCCYV